MRTRRCESWHSWPCIALAGVVIGSQLATSAPRDGCPPLLPQAQAVTDIQVSEAFLYVWITPHKLLRFSEHETYLHDLSTGVKKTFASETHPPPPQFSREDQLIHKALEAERKAGIRSTEWMSWSTRRLSRHVKPKKAPERLRALPPLHLRVDAMRRAPGRDLIAWLVRPVDGTGTEMLQGSTRNDDDRRWRHRMLKRSALYISRGDGTALRCIGEVAAKGMGGEQEPTGLRWLPDARGVSFIYNGKLWVLPIR